MIEPDFTKSPCQEEGDWNWQEFMQAVQQTDAGLHEFVVERLRLTHRNFHLMVHDLRLAKPQLYNQLRQGVADLKRPDKNEGQKFWARRQAWEIAKKLARNYQCDVGVLETPPRQTATVYLKVGDRPVTGLPKEIMRLSNQLAKDHGSQRKWTFGFDNRIFIADLTPAAIEALRKSSLVEKVEIEPLARIMSNEIPPYDPNAVNIDWGVARMPSATPWGKNNYGAGVKLAVLDTGIKADHECFWKEGVCVFKGGINVVAGNDNPADDHDHGSFCCGIIAAQHNAILGSYKGIAPGIELYAVKVLDSKGSGSFANIAAGIDWCRTHGIHIISMSLGGSAGSDTLKAACDNAWYAGIFIAAAAGNSGPSPNTVNYPGKYASCMAVAAVDYDEVVAGFSSRGPEVEISAPGRYIVGPWAGITYDEYVVAGSGDRYMCASGTSAACPHVAAAAALIRSWYPLATNLQIRQWLMQHARDL